MQLPQGTYCPLLKKDCVGMQCMWFIKLRGTDRNTGKEVDEWYCSIAAMPMLMIENSAVSRETGAAVESFRNEMVKQNGNLLASALLQALPSPKGRDDDRS